MKHKKTFAKSAILILILLSIFVSATLTNTFFDTAETGTPESNYDVLQGASYNDTYVISGTKSLKVDNGWAYKQNVNNGSKLVVEYDFYDNGDGSFETGIGQCGIVRQVGDPNIYVAESTPE